jgi:hypothetical protein
MAPNRRKVDSSLEFWAKVIMELEGAVVVTSLLVMLAVSLWYLLHNDLPKQNEIIISVIIGMLINKISTVVDFRYGGSQQSRKQSETNATLANTAQMAQATLSAATGVKPGSIELAQGEQVKIKAEGEPDAT